jgi:DNA-binding LacI/PurR family transcriptional regulator
VLDVLRNELKLTVPDDVQVIGFDNVPQAGMGGYSLSTVEQDSDLMSQAAVTTLLQQIKSGSSNKPEHIRVPVRLVVRKTTKSGL